MDSRTPNLMKNILKTLDLSLVLRKNKASKATLRRDYDIICQKFKVFIKLRLRICLKLHLRLGDTLLEIISQEHHSPLSQISEQTITTCQQLIYL